MNRRLPPLDHCHARIDAAYEELGHKIGWRFLTGPSRTYIEDTRHAFITLNPGGAAEDLEHPRLSSEGGSAYWIERWLGHPCGDAPLQRQVQELFAKVARIVAPDVISPRNFVESWVLTAHFIPFRSPKSKDLHRPDESLDFARKLWSDIFAAWTPRTILTIDRKTFGKLQDILKKTRSARIVEKASFPTGWGKYPADAVRLQLPGCDDVVILGRLPHLSRFKLFAHEESRRPVQTFLDFVYQPATRTPGSEDSGAGLGGREAR